MRLYVGVLGILLSGLSASACADEQSVDELVDAMIDAQNQQVRYICSNCYDELGLASQSACEDTAGYIGPSLRRCYIDAFERDEEAGIKYLECAQPILDEYTTCVESKLDCSNGNSLDGCDNDLDVGSESCGDLPPAIKNALDDCDDG